MILDASIQHEALSVLIALAAYDIGKLILRAATVFVSSFVKGLLASPSSAQPQPEDVRKALEVLRRTQSTR